MVQKVYGILIHVHAHGWYTVHVHVTCTGTGPFLSHVCDINLWNSKILSSLLSAWKLTSYFHDICVYERK